jgi:hypothetical protein
MLNMPSTPCLRAMPSRRSSPSPGDVLEGLLNPLWFARVLSHVLGRADQLEVGDVVVEGVAVHVVDMHPGRLGSVDRFPDGPV